MVNSKFDERTGRCGWCLRPGVKTRLCRVRFSIDAGWKEPIWLCLTCRRELHGKYKYIKPILKKENKNAN